MEGTRARGDIPFRNCYTFSVQDLQDSLARSKDSLDRLGRFL